MDIVWIVVTVCAVITLLVVGGLIYYFMQQDKQKSERGSLVQGGDYSPGSEEFVESLKRSI